MRAFTDRKNSSATKYPRASVPNGLPVPLFRVYARLRRWVNVTGDARPPARVRHTAAVVDGGFFVSGGTGSFGTLSDLWRRGEDSSEWMILADGPGVPLASTGPFNPHGASIMVSPWGMLSIGGMLQGSGVESTSDVWVLDPVSKRWRSVYADGGVNASSPVGRQDDTPPSFSVEY